MLMMPHNPPEYAGYIEAAGYQKVKDLYAWIYDVGAPMNPTIEKLAAASAIASGLPSVRSSSTTSSAKPSDCA